MKKVFLSLLLVLAATVGFAQTVGDAIYIYRHDGGFNAFFRSDIDSITYSTIAGDSLGSGDIMVQTIHTADSVYEIPLSSIDSVSFVNPETIFQPDVVRMDESMLGFLQAADGMTLTFSSSMPSSLRPRKGDLLLNVDTNNSLLTDGFVGRVTSVSETADAIQVICTKVDDVSDIFVQLIGIERIGDDSQQSLARRLGMDSGVIQKKEFSLNLEMSHESESENVEVSLKGALNGTVHGEYAYFLNLFNQVLDVTIHHEWDYSIGAGFKLKKEYEWPNESSTFQEKTLFKFLFPIAAPVFKVEMTGTPFVKAEGNIESTFSYQSRKYPYVTHIKYEDKKGFEGSTEPKKESGEENEPSFGTQISVNGSVMAGGKMGLYVGTIDFFGGYLSAKADIAIGPKIEADINMEASTGNDFNNFYTTFKDSKLSLGVVADVEIYGEAKFWGRNTAKTTFFEDTFSSPLAWEWYLLPEFDNVRAFGLRGYNSYANAYLHATRKCLFPVSIGFAAYDLNNNYLGSFYNGSYTNYQPYADEEADYIIRLEGLSKGKVTVWPVVKLFGNEMKATPSAELIKVETLSAEDNGDGTYTLKGKVFGDKTAIRYSFTYGQQSNLMTGTGEVFFADATEVKPDGEFSATIPTPEGEFFYYVASAIVLDANGNYNWNDGETLKETIIEDNPDAPTSGQMVDLGLSVKWAGWDVGADSPEVLGDLYAWGETETKSEYTSENYSHLNNGNIGGNFRTTGLYCNIGNNGDISGTQYDAAHVKWGGGWRMPTKEEAEELLSQCTKKRVNYKGVEGWLLTGPNGNNIFLRTTSSSGNFWTSTWAPQSTHLAWTIYGNSSLKVERTRCMLYNGLRIRAVCD